MDAVLEQDRKRTIDFSLSGKKIHSGRKRKRQGSGGSRYQEIGQRKEGNKEGQTKPRQTVPLTEPNNKRKYPGAVIVSSLKSLTRATRIICTQTVQIWSKRMALSCVIRCPGLLQPQEQVHAT